MSKAIDSRGHDSRAIANEFVRLARKAKRQLTILPLVKYVYLAHGWTLGYTQKPLICDRVEAWKFGPVVPKVHNAFRRQGIIITECAKDWLGNEYKVEFFAEQQKDIVLDVYDRYSEKEAGTLSDLTHLPGTPWSNHSNNLKEEIPNDEIKEYYTNIIENRGY